MSLPRLAARDGEVNSADMPESVWLVTGRRRRVPPEAPPLTESISMPGRHQDTATDAEPVFVCPSVSRARIAIVARPGPPETMVKDTR